MFLVDLILSDELDRLAEEMSFRVAAERRRERIRVDERLPLCAARSNSSREKESAIRANGWSGLDDDQKWLDEILAAEEAFRDCRREIIDEKALERELLSMRLNLTRFGVETIEVDSRDAAAEVIGVRAQRWDGDERDRRGKSLSVSDE